MNTAIKKIGSGLQVLKEDKRDLELGAFFGTISLKDVPNTDFGLPKPLFRKDQGDLDFCTAFATTEASENQEGVELDPLFQFAASCRLRGIYTTWGCDLRTAVSSAVKIGSLELSQRPLFMAGKSRDFIANWENWPAACFDKAAIHKKEGYYKVTKVGDLFDSIRAALWQHRDENRAIVVGAKWRDDWTPAPRGVVPEVYGDSGEGHAFKIYDQKVIDGVIHLVAQLSNGTDIGDNGDYYFRREIVNAEFGPFGQFMFKDLPPATAQIYAEAGISTQTNFLVRWITLIIGKIKQII